MTTNPRPTRSGDGLGDRFVRTARAFRRGFVDALEPLGITPHEARALRIIVTQGPIRLGVLATELRVTPRSVTDVVDALETAGLVRRAEDPSDRRAKAVIATEDGSNLQREVESRRTAHAKTFFGRLSAADQRELLRLLTLLSE